MVLQARLAPREIRVRLEIPARQAPLAPLGRLDPPAPRDPKDRPDLQVIPVAPQGQRDRQAPQGQADWMAIRGRKDRPDPKALRAHRGLNSTHDFP